MSDFIKSVMESLEKVDGAIGVAVAESKISKDKDWHRWMRELPFIDFSKYPNFRIKVIPPFAGALIRFVVKDEESGETVSVYFDSDQSLGFFEGPYWEGYPISGDNARYPLGKEDQMLEDIDKHFKRLKADFEEIE